MNNKQNKWIPIKISSWTKAQQLIDVAILAFTQQFHHECPWVCITEIFVERQQILFNAINSVRYWVGYEGGMKSLWYTESGYLHIECIIHVLNQTKSHN